MAKLKGHLSEPSKEDSKVIRTILYEIKTRCKQGTIGIGRNTHSDVSLLLLYKDDR